MSSACSENQIIPSGPITTVWLSKLDRRRESNIRSFGRFWDRSFENQCPRYSQIQTFPSRSGFEAPGKRFDPGISSGDVDDFHGIVAEEVTLLDLSILRQLGGRTR